MYFRCILPKDLYTCYYLYTRMKPVIMYTQHGAEQRAARGVSKEIVQLCIERGATSLQTDGFLSAYCYITVAWVKKHNVIWIKTVMLR